MAALLVFRGSQEEKMVKKDQTGAPRQLLWTKQLTPPPHRILKDSGWRDRGVSLKALVWLTETWRKEVKGDPSIRRWGAVVGP